MKQSALTIGFQTATFTTRLSELDEKYPSAEEESLRDQLALLDHPGKGGWGNTKWVEKDRRRELLETQLTERKQAHAKVEIGIFVYVLEFSN